MIARLAAILLVASCGRSHFDPDAFDAPRDDASGVPHNYAFVTSTMQPASMYMPDLSGADALCNARAAAAGLPGMYVAFLSKSGLNARDRLAGARGWLRTDGSPFLDQIGDINTGKLFHPLNLDEAGGNVGFGLVHTGSLGNGTAATLNCGGYSDSGATIIAGSTMGTLNDWLDTGTLGCMTSAHLYCFGIDHSNPVTVTPAVGRRMFVTVQPFLPDGTGLTKADALCNSEATVAGIAGSYHALLGTTTATGISRLGLSGAPWVRLDGIQLVANPLDVGAGDLLTTPNVSSAGTYYGGNVITGAGSPVALSVSSSESCGDWTSIGTAVAGGPNQVNRFFNIGSQTTCDKPIYCFED